MNDIVFFLDKYPNLSETFVADQIVGLLKRGENIRIVAIAGNVKDIPVDLEQQFKISKRIQYLTHSSRTHFNALSRFLKICLSLHRPMVRRALRSELYGPCAKNGFLAELVSNIKSPISAKVIISHFGTSSVTALALKELGMLNGELLPIFHGFDLSEHQVQETYSRWYKQLFSCSARVLAISCLWLQRLELMGCPPGKLELLRMGVDPEKFKFNAIRPKHDKLIIVSVGRLTEKKGYITALKGISAAVKLGVNLHYNIIGSGYQQPTLQRLISELDISHCVTLVGAITPALLPHYLNQADIFMLMSETAANGDMEGIPVSLMEAMSTGLITVSTYHSGIPELIDNRTNGFLITERDSTALADLLREIAAGQYDLEHIRRSARVKVSQDFNQHAWVSRLHQICREIIDAQ